MLLSVIICSKDRKQVLLKCLSRLLEHTIEQENTEIIIIDNNSNDGTAEAVHALDLPPYFQFLQEEKVGLSHARNKGVRASKGKWVFFLDDDCFVGKNFITLVHQIIHDHQYDCFGGIYEPVFTAHRPRWATTSLFASHLDGYEGSQVLLNNFLTGGCLCIRREIILQEGFFSTNLGMKGDQIGYAEETLLQKRLREKGVKLWLVPSLRVEHLVGSHKLSLRWQIMSRYAKGRDHIDILYAKQKTMGFLFEVLKIIFIQLPKSIVKTLLRKDYFWENLIIDVFGNFSEHLGRYQGR